MEAWSPRPLEPSLLQRRIRELSSPLPPLPTGEPPRLPALPDVGAVLFDVYGTLVVSGCGELGVAVAEGRASAFEEACLDAGLDGGEGRGPEAMDRLEAEIRRDHDERRLAGAPFPEVEIRSIWTSVLSGLGIRASPRQVERLSLEYELRVNPVWPMPGAASAMATLARGGLPLGVVSNAQFFTPLLFPGLFGASTDELGLDDDLCAWSYLRGRAKPAGEIFDGPLGTLRRRHGLPPDRVLYVGNDRRNDVATAASLGCRTALFAGDARSLRLREDDPTCAGVEADAVLTDLAQLPGLLTLAPQPR